MTARQPTAYSAVAEHLASFFAGREIRYHDVVELPIAESIPGLSIAEVAPRNRTEDWVYVTIGTSEAPGPAHPHEFMLLSPLQDVAHFETLKMVSFFHVDPGRGLDVGQTVNIGRGWMKDSGCDHLLVSGYRLQSCEKWHSPD